MILSITANRVDTHSGNLKLARAATESRAAARLFREVIRPSRGDVRLERYSYNAFDARWVSAVAGKSKNFRGLSVEPLAIRNSVESVMRPS